MTRIELALPDPVPSPDGDMGDWSARLDLNQHGCPALSRDAASTDFHERLIRIGERGWIRTSAGLRARAVKSRVPSTAWLLVLGGSGEIRTHGGAHVPRD
jgi:hypothetical protein